MFLILSIFPMPVTAAGSQLEFSEISPEVSPEILSEISPETSSRVFNETASNDTTLMSLLQFDKDLPRYDWGLQAPAPAKFTGVTYTLADNVVKVNPDVSKNILSMQQVENPNPTNNQSIRNIIEQGGLYKADQLKKATGLSIIKPGSVFVDLENDLAFKVPTLPDETGGAYQGYVPVIRPEMQEIIKDFNIPAQKVRLNQSNVTHFAKDANGNSLDSYLKKPGQTYVMSHNSEMEPLKPTHLKDVIAEFSFPEAGITLNGVTPSGGMVSVNVKGYLAIGDMDVDGYYEKWKYGFWFSVAEEIQLQATVAMELHEEVRIPILGVDIGFDSDIGSIAGGLFIIVGVDGKFTLKMEARQWTKLNKVGLKGKCVFYVPCTISPLHEFGDSGFYLDSHFNGAIDGYVKGGALLELSLLGIDIIGAGVFAGMGVNLTVSGEYIEANLYGIIQAYIKFIGKQKNIINFRPNILHKRQVNSGGYIVTFKEVCGYRDEVWGTLQYDAGINGIVPEPGKGITLIVRRIKSGSTDTIVNEKSYPSKTDERGNFHLSGVDLQKDDEVFIRLQERGKTNYVKSAITYPTFPFDKVIVLEADFFNDYIKGYVPSAIVKDWNTTQSEQQSEQQKEIVFDLKKSLNSSLKVNGVPVTLDSKGFFNLTGTNVLPQDSYSCELAFEGWIVKSSPVKPTVDFGAHSIRLPVSYERILENSKPADVSKLNETVIITNNRGSKVYTEDAAFTVSGYTQAATVCYLINPKTGLPIMQAMGLPTQTQLVKLYAVQGAEEGSFGASYFTNTIIKKWLWEPKPGQIQIQEPDIEQLPESKPEQILDPKTGQLLDSMNEQIPDQKTRQLLDPKVDQMPSSITRFGVTQVNPNLVAPSSTTNTTNLPAPASTTNATNLLAPSSTTNITNMPAPSSTTNTNVEPGTLNIIPIRPIDPDLSKYLPSLPQHSFTLSYDDNFDKYDDYNYYNNYTSKLENYSEQTDGTQTIKWDDKIAITYEGAQIILEIKDDRRGSNADSKFETLSAEWLNKDIEGMLNHYMEKMGGSLVFPMPDEMNRTGGISNIGMLPSWSSQAAQKMVDAGIMDLSSGQVFKSGTVTRSECAAYLVHVFGIMSDMKKPVFLDIVPANPYIPEINAAVSYGIINGYSPEKFGPGDPVTREQMAVMVMRGLKKKLGSSLSIPATGKNFADKDKFSSWSGSAIYEISALKIMNGYPDGRFGAKDNITFNEMAVMLDNLNGFLNK